MISGFTGAYGSNNWIFVPGNQVVVGVSNASGPAPTAFAATFTETVPGQSANGPPVIGAPGAATITQNQATPVLAVGLSESGNTTNETFTVTVTAHNGLLSATGSAVSGAETSNLAITGSLAQANADLATLTDMAAGTASDTITISASDSLGNQASPQSIAVAVQPLTLSAPAASNSTIDWGSLEASFHPSWIDSVDWNLIWDRFIAGVGTTMQSLLAALVQDATTLAKIGQPTNNLSTLLTYQLEEASGVLPNIILAATTDLAPPCSGLAVSLMRTCSASLLDRNNLGVWRRLDIHLWHFRHRRCSR